MRGTWIWQNTENRKNEYVDFLDFFEAEDQKSFSLDISVDGDYIAWVNGQRVGNGQYRDYEHYKIKDTLDITPYVKKGQNRLCIQAWHIGGGNFVNAIEKAGLFYSVDSDGDTLACSGEKTLCRISKDYLSHHSDLITPQLGYTFYYDADRADRWLTDCADGFRNAVVSEIEVTEVLPRPIEKLEEGSFLAGKIVQQGVFFLTGGERLSEKMQQAALALRDENTFLSKRDGSTEVKTEESCDGLYFIFDLGREEVGNLYFDLETDEKTQLYIGYGEHLEYGRVATAVGVRNFCAGYATKPGRQVFSGSFRRFGLRYLTLFVCGKSIKLHKFGITPLRYPLIKTEFSTGNYLRDKIYETSARTLELCMHDAYEDCPWREQSFYNMDSRNQMLCGYYAFHEYRFVRAALELVSHGVREDGFLSIVFPAGSDVPIPSFNLIVFTQFKEYLMYSNDREFVKGKSDFLRKLMQAFLDRVDENGLLPVFPAPFWNFYEWQATLQGALSGDAVDRGYECPLSAFLAFALGEFAELLEMLGMGDEAEKYRAIRTKTNEAIRKTFFDRECGLFGSFSAEKSYSMLVNALCVLCGAADGLPSSRIDAALKGNCEEVLPCTLSMEIFRYEALLKLDESNASFILSDIDENYYAMLSKGATSFWETAKGYADFENAGSLCHGWSALPVYYYNKLKSFMK